MPAWILKTKALKGLSSGRGRPCTSGRGAGAGASDSRVSSSCRTPKFSTAEPKSTGVVTPSRKVDCSCTCPIASSSSDSSTAVGQASGSWTAATPPAPAPRGRWSLPGGARVADEVAGGPVEHPAEVPGDADRPGQRGGLEAGAVADLVHQRQRLEARAVPLVDDGDDRDAAVLADVEQLHRLRLEALGGVEQHHGAVDGGQHPVGVLGEVGVAGRVEQVDDRRPRRRTAAPRWDGDAAGLLHVHPVGHVLLRPALPWIAPASWMTRACSASAS
jgi:hypothetical protein